MTPYEKVIAALEERDLLVGGWGTGQRALCPSHDDSRPSLSVGEGDDGRALVYCFVGCSVNDVSSALGLSVGDLFDGTQDAGRGTPVAEYVYTDEDGQPLIRVTRTEPKGFYQERWEDGEWKAGLRDTRRVPYNLAAVVGAQEVWIVEGEKDVESLRAEGVTATTGIGGASNWRDEWAELFRDKDVTLVGDRGEAGDRYVSRVRLSVGPVARSLRVLTVDIEAQDITDHLNLGYKLEELEEEGEVDLAEFGPVDWQTFETEDHDWLFRPYVPARGRVLVFGKRGSLKSLWAMWLAAKLAEEGKKVAYFSIEMTPSDTVKRLKNLKPSKNMVVFTKDLDLSNPGHVDKMLIGLKDFDLIVIDSWSAVHQFGKGRMNQNDEVAALDKAVFQPLIRETGATVMLIDNQGHDAITDDGVVKQAHARGASAKEDKMETCLWFERPKSYDNYLTTLSMTKMRLDEPMAEPVHIRTPQDRIEFYVEGTNRPHWPGMYVEPEATTDSDVPLVEPPSAMTSEELEVVRGFEQRRLARLKDKFGAVDSE